MYHCVCCEAPVFSSEAKYDSGTGWPAFKEAHGSRMKASPPSFVALTTAWVVLGQRFFVKIAIPTWVTCLMMDQTRLVSGSVSTAWPSHLNPEKTTNLTWMSRSSTCTENTIMFHFKQVHLTGKMKDHLIPWY